MLHSESGCFSGYLIAIKPMRTIKIGKSSANDFVVSDDTVSRQHAVLTILDSGEVIIKDLNSLNGTFVDGKRISEAKLLPGQVVSIGKTILDWQKMVSSASNPRPKNFRPSDAVETRKVGKEMDNDIHFPYPDVSRRHALLCKKQNGSISIVDCDSTNGTFVNGFPITGEKVLQHRDKVLIANKYPFDWEKVFPDKSKSSNAWKFIVGIAAAFAILFGLWFLFGYERPLSPAKIYAMYKNSVVLIFQESGYRVTINGRLIGDIYSSFSKLNYCHVKDGEPEPGSIGASGTGFFISKDGKIMTNRHVVSITDKEKEKQTALVKEAIQNVFVTLASRANSKEESIALLAIAQNVEVNYEVNTYILRNDTYFSSKSDLIPCSVIKTSQDDNLDVAIIQTNQKGKEITDWDEIRLVDLSDIAKTTDMEIGDKVYTIGFPKSFTIATTEIGIEANNQSGEITQERGEYIYGHNITIHQGASGSPVFDCHGRFAGIIVSGFLGLSQGYNHAVQPQKAAEFVK